MGVLITLTDEYFGVSKREEDCLVLTPREREDITILDEDRPLTTYLSELLQNGASLDFYLGDYISLANMLNTLGVKLRICKGIKWFYDFHSRDFLDEIEEYWRRKLSQRLDLLEPILKRLEYERKWMSAYTIRGRYLPEEKIIELYPDEMEDEWEKYENPVDYLLLTTFVHEAMHAYFDRPGHSSFAYAYFVEEPMAEFGMLLYLKETGVPEALQKWAYEDVAKKRCCYRYGTTLFNQYCDWNISLRSYLEAYKYGISEYEMLDVDKSGERVALPFPTCKKVTVSRASASKTVISKLPTTFDFERKIGVVGKHDLRIFIKLPEKVVVSKSLAKGDILTITFYDKKGNMLFTAKGKIMSQNRIILPKVIQDLFIVHYGNKKTLFGLCEMTGGVWSAQEL